MPKYLSALLFLLAFWQSSQAQDPRFSQYYADPLRVNPALTGIFDGRVRLQALYRDQFSSVVGPDSYRSMAAAYDMRLPVARFDHLGIGLNFMRDEAGTSNFTRIHGSLGSAYIRQLSGGRGAAAHYLAGAVQLGFGQWSFEANRLWYSSQFDPATISVDEGQGSGENFEGQENRLHLSMNAGLLWYALMGENASVYAGAGVYHLNQPDIAFSNNAFQPLDRRIVAHAGGEFPLNEDLSLLPAAIFMSQGPANSMTLGAQIKYYGRRLSELDMKVGIWLHANQSPQKSLNLESFIIAATIELPEFSLGIGYDFTNSPVALINNGRGALELFIAYRYLEEKGRSYQVSCPSF